MTSQTYADELRALISDSQTHNISYYGAKYAEPPDDSGTTHLSILSKDGSAVSLTSTINY